MVAGDHDVGGEVAALAPGAERDDAADVGHFDGAAWDFTGEGVLGAFGVVVDFHPVVHGADDGEFVGDFGGFCEEFGELDSGDGGGDGFVGASVFGGRVGFGIPRVHVGEAALFEDNEDTFCASEVAAFCCGGGGGECFWGQGGEEAPEADSDETACGVLEEASTGDAFTERVGWGGEGAHWKRESTGTREVSGQRRRVKDGVASGCLRFS